MGKTIMVMLLLAAVFSISNALAATGSNGTSKPWINSVTDISHDFTFYFDGRFAQQYIGDNGVDARNWGTLYKFDLSNANLLVLNGVSTPCPYFPQDIAAIKKFMEGGGGVLALGDFALFRDEKKFHLNDVAKPYGAEFVDQVAAMPLKPAAQLKTESVLGNRCKTLKLSNPKVWEVLVTDADGIVVAARRKVGKGNLFVASRSLFGQIPDSSDPINRDWVSPLLLDLAKNKTVDPKRPPRNSWKMDNETDMEGLRVQYSDYLRDDAKAIFGVYKQSRTVIDRLLKVPPAKGMITTMMLIPTGGGGFSSGEVLGIGVWWGDFPRQKYPIVEMISHEAGHSWVLPFGEPMWNEPLATFIGINVGRELGYKKEADASLKGTIDAGLRIDPDMTKYDIAYGKDVPRDAYWGKTMWVWQHLQEEKPDILARYFQAKRKLIDPKKFKDYTPDDCIAVVSNAMGRDMFPWFRSLGLTVDRSKTTVPMKF